LLILFESYLFVKKVYIYPVQIYDFESSKAKLKPLTCVMVGEPLQSIERTLTIIDTFPELDLDSDMLVFKLVDALLPHANAELTSFLRSSSVKPCLARGAGSTPRLVKRSATQAKHFNAVSAT